MFRKFKNKNCFKTLGVMTGTSMDGIDISYIDTNGTNYVKIINEKSYQYPIKLQKELKLIIHNKPTSKKKIIDYFNSYNEKIDKIIISYITKFVSSFKIEKNKIKIIGLSGQTMYHNPSQGISIQLGSGKVIAKKFNIKTVSNFRENDLKNGGQGAPIGSYYHKYLLKKIDRNKIIINLGGISNCSFIYKNNLYSSDIGPANCIIDDLAFYFYKKKFDRNGNKAVKGILNKKIINIFEKDIFFKQKYPKSLDRNYFIKYYKKLITINKNDALFTATYMTVLGIKKFMNNKEIKNKSIILTGGGRKNILLIKLLENILDMKVNIIDNFNMNGDLIESQMFAYLCVRSIKKLIISGKNTTGARKNISGGDFYY